MAGEEGLEPSNAGIKIQCLNQLGDSPTQLAVCHDSAQMRRLKFMTNELGPDYSKSFKGWELIPLAFQTFQRWGANFNTSSACSSCAKAQKTHAPEPVILASPYAWSQ